MVNVHKNFEEVLKLQEGLKEQYNRNSFMGADNIGYCQQCGGNFVLKNGSHISRGSGLKGQTKDDIIILEYSVDETVEVDELKNKSSTLISSPPATVKTIPTSTFNPNGGDNMRRSLSKNTKSGNSHGERNKVCNQE